MDNKTLKIGEVSKLSGLSIDAIRFYEDKEIIKPITRTSTGYRLYDKNVIKVINFIKQAKALGFTLLEIKDFMALKIKNNSQCEIVKTKNVSF
jgi:DNA-binding transcriptional MerR regulator